MGNQSLRGIPRLVAAMKNTIAGVVVTWKQEEAFRQELMLSTIMIPAAFWLGTSFEQRALLIGTCLIVLITELLNSAIETVVDRIGTEHHELSKQAKDMGSAAVFMSLLLAGIVWTMIAYQRFLS